MLFIEVLNIGTSYMIMVIVLKIKHFGFTLSSKMPKDAAEMTNCIDPDQTAP